MLRPHRHLARAAAVVAGVALVGGGLVTTNIALADHTVSLPGSNLEIDSDANLTVEHALPSIDWNTVNETRKNDTPSGGGDESFGNGAKENTAVPSVVDGGIPPNKSDLKSFGVFQEGSGGSGFLNLYWSRVQDPTGTTNMDFEFNKRQCTPGTADGDCTANGMTPKRSAGDLLVIYDLSNGGTSPTLSLREWTGSVWGPPMDLTSSSKATGSINTSAITAAQAGGADGIGAHSARTFGEAQIDLSEVFDPNTCQSFGSAYLKSRSSDSFTAALKDFVPPAAVNISNCGSVTIDKTGNNLNGGPLAGAGFTLYKDLGTIGGTRESAQIDTITDFTCTSDAQGDCDIADVPFGEYWLVETQVPTNYLPVADRHVSVTGTTPVHFDIENVRQTVTTSITTQQRWLPNHQATISASPGQGDLAGTVVFKLYEADSCTGTAAWTSPVIDVATGSGGALSRTVVTANTNHYVVDKSVAWKVEYTSSNQGQLDSQSQCDRSTVDIISNTTN